MCNTVVDTKQNISQLLLSKKLKFPCVEKMVAVAEGTVFILYINT